MAFRPWHTLVLLALLGTVGCGGGGSSGASSGDGGAGGEGGAGPVTLSIDDAKVREGNRGTTDLVFTVTLSRASDDLVRVAYKTRDGTAEVADLPDAGGNDYEEGSGTLRFDPGETKETISVEVNGDDLMEPDETLGVVLSRPFGATLERANAEGTIENDDEAPPQITIGHLKLDEGNAGTKDATLNVGLTKASDLPITVTYSTEDITAQAGDDYDAIDGTLTFAPGETLKTLAVPIHGDTFQEPDETLRVRLANPTNATFAMPEATLTIVNDDSAGPVLSINDATVSEGNAGSKLVSFTIKLSVASTDTVSVDYATVDGTATASGLSYQGGVDYVPTSDSVTFTPGQTSKQIDIVVNGDTLNEADETFTVELFNGENAVVVDPQGTGTISNDDTLPTVSVSDVSVYEGAAGSRTATFGVTLSHSSGRAVSVDFTTLNDTASSGSDYQPASGKLTFDPGATYAAISVSVYGDVLSEDDEVFLVDLIAATNATVADGEAQGTIFNDDSVPLLTIENVALAEGDAGTQNAIFNVTLSQASGQTVSVDWVTSDVTASAGLDYVAASGTLTFNPGVTTKTISVAVKGDSLDEPNETFAVDLSNALHATVADGHGVGTIIADDSSLPGLNIGDASVAEGTAGTATLTFTVTLDSASAQQVKVNYTTASDTASAASDFQATSGTLTFDPGQTSKTIDVLVNGDTLYEPDETLLVTLSGAVNAFVADGDGVGLINNDDAAPTLSINDVTIAEGNAGTKQAIFTVSLSGPSSFQVSVAYATVDGTALEGGSASLGQDDYEAASNVLVIAAGKTSATLSVPINGDAVPEGNETFLVQLSAAQNAGISDAQGQGTITNDDAIPSVSIDDVSVIEGDAGTKTFTFTVSLSGPSGSQVTVDFATANGTAVSPSDYTADNGTVTFNPGETTATIGITVVGDKSPEAHKDETFYVNLSNAVGATIGDNQGVGTIVSDD